jgi:hypothetical protein
MQDTKARNPIVWRDGTPDTAARMAEKAHEIEQVLKGPIESIQADGIFEATKADKDALKLACVQVRAMLDGDPLWVCEAWDMLGHVRRALSEIAEVHGMRRPCAGLVRAFCDAEDAAKAARKREVSVGGSVGGGATRMPFPAWTLPPQLREAATKRKLCPPFRHGLTNGDQWWGIGDGGSLVAIRRVDDPSEDDGETVVKMHVVANRPVWLVSRGVDIETGNELSTLAWREESGPGAFPWREFTVQRGATKDPKKLVDLANQSGCPVTAGECARAMVDWLMDLENDRAYAGIIGERIPLTTRVGWFGDPVNPTGFLALDNLWIQMREDDDSAGIRLHAPEGFSQLVDRCAPKGQARGLWDVMRQATPTLWIAVGAALASVLVAPLGIDPWILDVAGTTTGGKSSTMKVAAAVWGSPDEIVRTWRDTDAFVFGLAVFLNALPVMVDDTKTERDPERIARMVYSLTSGTERGRGRTDGGVQVPRAWRSVGILTGEQPVTSFTTDAGTRARVLPLWGAAFGTDENAGTRAESAVEAARLHFGHVGPGFVRWLAQSGGLAQVRSMHAKHAQALLDRISEGGKPDGICVRLRKPAASVLAALEAAGTAGLLPVTPATLRAVFDALTASVQSGASDADQPLAALRLTEGARASNPHRWCVKEAATAAQPPSQGWQGVILSGTDQAGAAQIAWLPHELSRILEAGGYRPKELMEAWRDRGWLKVDPKGFNPAIRLGGARPRLVVLDLERVSDFEASTQTIASQPIDTQEPDDFFEDAGF